MKRSNELPLSDALKQLLNNYQLRERLNETRLKTKWENLFGKAIAKYTVRLSVKNKKLFLTISSAPLRQELSFNKKMLIDRINEAIEEGFIDDVIFR